LLVVFVAVALVRDTMPMWPLVLVLLAYFALLTAVPAHTRPRFAGLGVVAASAVLALTAAAVIPGLGMGSLIRDGLVPNPGVRFAGGSDPLVDLGDDLRTGARYEVLRYTTSASQPIYLRLSTLGRFDGDTWTHSPGDEVRFDDGLVLEDAVLPAGAMATVEIEILSLTSDNLPVPYQPVQVGSVEGRLVVDQDDLSITFRRGQLNRQSYWVDAWLADPNPIRSYTALPRPDSEYLELPDDLPNVIGLNARAATELATTPMEAARALENYFHTSGFRYSLTAPSQEGYDGDSAEVVAQFLEAKSGYCVHFAAAMTLMAREVGIPARIAVGYSPGRPVSNSGASTTFSVRADQLHAWPELWIDGIGWMGFEPTVSAGSAPRSTSASPSASPSAAASASATASTAASSPGATPSFTPSPTASSQNDAAGQAPPWPLIWAAVGLVGLALIGSMPWLVRAIIRRRRLGAGLAGVWREVHATAADLGLANPPWKTPAATAADLEVLLKAGGQAEAAAQVLELAGLVEATAYGPNRPDGETPAASVTELRRLGRGIVQGMTHSVTGRERWRGRLLPQTLFKRSGTGNYSTAPESRDEAD
jgi:transglutaminase-like putative cysteine protease